MPGMLNGACERTDAGNSNSVRSIVVTIRFNTQSVIAIGTRISSPVKKYFLSIVWSKLQVDESEAGLAAGFDPESADAALGLAGLSSLDVVPLLFDAASAAGGLAVFESALDGALSESAAGAALLPAGGLRKSVTYQPDPLSWNPAAVTCLRNPGSPQDGHTTRGASEIFCRAS